MNERFSSSATKQGHCLRWSETFARYVCVASLLLLAGLCDGVESPKAAVPASSNSVTIPFQFQRDHVMVRVRVNESEPLLFMLDSGYAITMISPDQATA